MNIRIEQSLTVKRVVLSQDGVSKLATLQGDDGTFLQLELGTDEERRAFREGRQFVMSLESLKEART